MKKIAIIIQKFKMEEELKGRLPIYRCIFQKSMKYILLFLMGGLLAIHTVERFMI